MASFNATVDRYKALLANIDVGSTDLADEDLDIWGPTIEGTHQGTDQAYAKLLGKLADRQFAGMQPDLRENVLAYYKDLKTAAPAKSTRKRPNSTGQSISLID